MTERVAVKMQFMPTTTTLPPINLRKAWFNYNSIAKVEVVRPECLHTTMTTSSSNSSSSSSSIIIIISSSSSSSLTAD